MPEFDVTSPDCINTILAEYVNLWQANIVFRMTNADTVTQCAAR